MPTVKTLPLLIVVDFVVSVPPLKFTTEVTPEVAVNTGVVTALPLFIISAPFCTSIAGAPDPVVLSVNVPPSICTLFPVAPASP